MLWVYSQMNAYVPPLPQELIDTIIAHLPPGSTSTLQRTSIVSQAFLAPSQRRLFRYLRFGISYRTAPYAHTDRLLSILLSKPSLLRHVRSLSITIYDWPKESSRQDHYLPRLLRLLKHVRELTVEYEPTRHDSSPFPIAVSTAIRNLLRSPTLRTARFVKICPCRLHYAGLAELGHLKHVEFEGSHHSTRCSHGPIKLPNVKRRMADNGAFARIEMLSIGGLGSCPFVNALFAGPQPHVMFSMLRELKIIGWRHGVLDAAWEVMRLASATLESIIFYWPYGRSCKPSTVNPIGPIQLSSLPNLRTLIFYVPHVFRMDDDVCLWYPWIRAILTPRSSLGCSSRSPPFPSSLQTIGLAIEVFFDDEWFLDPDSCQIQNTGDSLVEMELDRVLDEALKKSTYPNLRRVHVEFVMHEHREVVVEEMQECSPIWFPRLERRRLLTSGVSALGDGWMGRFEDVHLSPI